MALPSMQRVRKIELLTRSIIPSRLTPKSHRLILKIGQYKTGVGLLLYCIYYVEKFICSETTCFHFDFRQADF